MADYVSHSFCVERSKKTNSRAKHSRHDKHLLFVSGIFFSILLAACGGGGGGSTDTAANNQGSLARADVDVDDDGLIEIATLEELDWMRNDLEGKSLKDNAGRVNSKGCPTSGCKGYELVADLNFDTNGDGVRDSKDAYYDYDKNGTNAGWLPIGGAGKNGDPGIPFRASFDGNNHRMSNLYINRSNASGVGLIGHIDGQGTSVSVSNVHLDGPLTSVTGQDSVGMLVGKISSIGTLTLRNNKISGAVTGTGDVGGMIGRLDVYQAQLVATNNESAVTVTGVERGTGGLIGYFSGKNSTPGSVSISNNHSSGSITGGEEAGGLIGFALGEFTMENCYSSANVTSTPGTAGGLFGTVGGQGAIKINSARATGNVVASGIAGGLIGSFSADASSDITVSNSYVVAASVVGTNAGGLIGWITADGGKFTITETYTEVTSIGNQLNSQVNGGLLGYVTAESNAHIIVSMSYSSSDVFGTDNVGGLIGSARTNESSALEITDVFASGNVTSAGSGAGGLVAELYRSDSSFISWTHSYAVGTVNAVPDGFPRTGGLAGLTFSAAPTTGLNISSSYWATDTTTRSNALGAFTADVVQTDVYGASLNMLSCPTAANDVTCTGSVELYHGWNTALNSDGQAAWQFNSGQLPALRFGGVIHQPFYSNGRFSVARL